MLDQICAGTEPTGREAGLTGEIQAARHKEAGSEIAVHQQQDAAGGQHSERQQAQDRGDKPCPAGQRHTHH